MTNNIRYKERQSGKTTDLIELTKILLSLNRKIILLVHNRRALEYLKINYRDFLETENKNLVVGNGSDLNFLRGMQFDTILIDEKSLIDNYSQIHFFAQINNAIIYATDDINYQKNRNLKYENKN